MSIRKRMEEARGVAARSETGQHRSGRSAVLRF